jgi:hypothetical protein
MTVYDTYKNLQVLCTICFVFTVTLVALNTTLPHLLRKLHKGLIILPCILGLSLFANAQSIGCDGFGYLIETTGTPAKQYLIQIDISSGVSTIVYSMDIPAVPDAMGFNPTDGNLWGYASDSSVFVFRGPVSSITYASYPITGLPVEPYDAGDISYNGILYLYANDSSAIQEVDVNPSSPTYLHYLGALPIAPLNIFDFAFNPVDSNLYTVTSGGATHQLISINPTTGVETVVGAVAGLPAGDSYGAMYSDASGDLFLQSNTTGKIYRINSTSTTSSPFATFITTTVTSSINSDGARCNSPITLPVQLTSFSGIMSGSTSVLTWQTSEEINFKEFVLEYSSNSSTNFQPIDTIKASGSTSGDTYNALYDAPQGPGYYVLKIMDIDGSYRYSNVVSLTTTTVATAHISLFPNPAKDQVIVRGLVANDQIKIIDMMGRVLNTEYTTDDAKQIDISNYPPGFYMVQVLQDGQIVSNMKLVKY